MRPVAVLRVEELRARAGLVLPCDDARGILHRQIETQSDVRIGRPSHGGLHVGTRDGLVRGSVQPTYLRGGRVDDSHAVYAPPSPPLAVVARVRLVGAQMPYLKVSVPHPTKYASSDSWIVESGRRIGRGVEDVHNVGRLLLPAPSEEVVLLTSYFESVLVLEVGIGSQRLLDWRKRSDTIGSGSKGSERTKSTNPVVHIRLLK